MYRSITLRTTPEKAMLWSDVASRYGRKLHCKFLASELARLWVRWGGSEPAEDPAPLLQRFRREDV